MSGLTLPLGCGSMVVGDTTRSCSKEKPVASTFQPDPSMQFEYWSDKASTNARLTKDSMTNAVLAMYHMGLHNEIRYNEMSDGYIYKGEEFNPKKHIVGLVTEIELRYHGLKYKPGNDRVASVMNYFAHFNKFHPVRDMLMGLTWDGVPRLDRVHLEVFGTKGDEERQRLNQETAKLIFRGAVARALWPGMHFPYVPILYSPGQGRGKGDILKAMGEDFYRQGVEWGGFDFQKKFIENNREYWIVESGEFDVLVGKPLSTFKSFATDEAINSRMAYGQTSYRYNVGCVVIGTTNKRAVLADLDHRRTPVLYVAEADPSVDAIERHIRYMKVNRDQLLAEQMAEFKQPDGSLMERPEKIVMDESMWDAALEHSRTFEVDSPFQDWLESVLDPTASWFVTNELNKHTPPHAQVRPGERSTVLHRFGFNPDKKWIPEIKKPAAVWIREVDRNGKPVDPNKRQYFGQLIGGTRY